jgi:hypothetical protein
MPRFRGHDVMRIWVKFDVVVGTKCHWLVLTNVSGELTLVSTITYLLY